MFSSGDTKFTFSQKQSKKWLSLMGLAGLLSSLVITFAPAIAQSSVSLSKSFRPDPVRLGGEAGGRTSLSNLSGGEGNCRGFANNQPNHIINLTETFPQLDIVVYTKNLNDDPTMLIKGPGGLVICADDEYQGRNPQVTRRRLPAGTYQIWVGSSDASKPIGYTLSLSEIRQK